MVRRGCGRSSPGSGAQVVLPHVPAATLRYWRHQGAGPESFKMGPRRVVYREQDVLRWIDAQYAQRMGRRVEAAGQA